MSHLSNLLNSTAKEALANDEFEPRKLAPSVWAQLDEDEKSVVGQSEIVRRLKYAAKKISKKNLDDIFSGQFEMPFQIDAAMALDIEENSVKLTTKLSEQEYRHAVAIRRRQIRNDRASLKEMEHALLAAAPYWRDNPAWTFGQCMGAYVDDIRSETASNVA